MVCCFLVVSLTSLVAQTVKCLPTMWETRIRPLGWEDTLEKEVAIHSVLLPRKSHGRRSMVGSSVHGVAKSQTRLSDFSHSLSLPGFDSRVSWPHRMILEGLLPPQFLGRL